MDKADMNRREFLRRTGQSAALAGAGLAIAKAADARQPVAKCDRKAPKTGRLLGDGEVIGIGVIGASFVITQYHTSVMFAPNIVGTANATTAGWGNCGGGVNQLAMPLLSSALVVPGIGEFWA